MKTRNSLGFELESERVIAEDEELTPLEHKKMKSSTIVKKNKDFVEVLTEGNESDGDVRVALPVSSAVASKKKVVEEVPKDLTERLKQE